MVFVELAVDEDEGDDDGEEDNDTVVEGIGVDVARWASFSGMIVILVPFFLKQHVSHGAALHPQFKSSTFDNTYSSSSFWCCWVWASLAAWVSCMRPTTAATMRQTITAIKMDVKRRIMRIFLGSG